MIVVLNRNALLHLIRRRQIVHTCTQTQELSTVFVALLHHLPVVRLLNRCCHSLLQQFESTTEYWRKKKQQKMVSPWFSDRRQRLWHSHSNVSTHTHYPLYVYDEESTDLSAIICNYYNFFKYSILIHRTQSFNSTIQSRMILCSLLLGPK